jgi:hypothetical protein
MRIREVYKLYPDSIGMIRTLWHKWLPVVRIILNSNTQNRIV